MSKAPLDTTSKHPFSLVGLADRTWNSTLQAALSVGWGPLTGLAESAVISLMRRIKKGHLRVLTYSHIYSFPDNLTQSELEQVEHKAELRVVNPAFWIRLCAMGDLGFSEAYMFGDVECDDLVALFRIFLDNKDNLDNLDSRFSYLLSIPQKLTSYRFYNSLSNTRSNISAHYDISNAMFAGFLSEDMTYSCAIFEDLDGDLKPGVQKSTWSGGHGLKRVKDSASASTTKNSESDSHSDELYTAQKRKLNHILQKARIQPGHRVLEIGSGWGSMAILIAETVPGTKIDTLTLSDQQQALAQERIAAKGLQDRITVHLMDYRNMPAHWEGAFDRFISIEMMEAVGYEFLPTYWKLVDWALKKNEAVGVIQCITIPEARFARYMSEVDFIRRYIFPGGFLPTITFLVKGLEEATGGRLVVDSIGNIGPHYARTLREWRIRFLARFEDVVVPALKAEYPEVMNGPRGKEEIEVFKRKWIYYYCYCEVGFTTRTLGDHIMTFAREGYQDYGCDVFE